MSDPALVLVIAAVWLSIGAVAVALLQRRGHDAFPWAVLFLFLGPIAVPLAISSDRHRPADPASPVQPGGLDLLVSHDGSEDAQAALDTAVSLFGAQLTSMALAAVVDFEAPSTVRGREAQRDAQARLDQVAKEVQPRVAGPVSTVILFGEPAAALQRFATDHGYELIVAGSVASRSVARRSTRTQAMVPLLIGPATS